jgi:mRNA interferase MazF
LGALAIGQVVLIPFPFSDLSQAKMRPAVVLAEAGRDDLIGAIIILFEESISK